MLDSRKKKVLQAIIEEYINTAEPVSSGTLVETQYLVWNILYFDMYILYKN